MKVYKEIGSKERFVDMFQKVNKIRLNEAFGQNYNPNNVLDFAFSELVNEKLTVKHSNTQANGNESYVELLCVDSQGNNITFTFKATTTEGDQDGVYNVDDVVMTSFSFDDAQGEETIELDENGLRQFNAQHVNDYFDIIDEYMDVEDEEPEMDEMYEDAVKLIDKVPYKAGSERMVTHAEYADQKPTNPALRVNAPELQKFVKEGDYGEDDVIGQEIKRFNQEIGGEDDVDTGVPSEEDFDEEVSEEKKRIILQAYDNLMAKNIKNPSYSPTMMDIAAEVGRITGQPIAKKNRVFPKEAEPFMESEIMYEEAEVPEVNDMTPEEKKKYILLATKKIDEVLGDKKDILPKDEYFKLVKEIAMKYYEGSSASMNEDEKKSEYPKELGKEFSPEKQYNKTQKKHTKKIKLKEEEDEMSSRDEENPELDVSVPQGEMNGENDIQQLAKEKEEQGEVLQGGKGDDKSPLEFDPDQILKGLEVEMEHTDDPLVSLEIVLDHLTEDPEYYTVKDNPEASAQQGAAADASGEMNQLEKDNPDAYPKGWKEMDGMFMNPNSPIRKAANGDDEMTDVLLGYEPKNVGDDMNEEIAGYNKNTRFDSPASNKRWFQTLKPGDVAYYNETPVTLLGMTPNEKTISGAPVPSFMGIFKDEKGNKLKLNAHDVLPEPWSYKPTGTGMDNMFNEEKVGEHYDYAAQEVNYNNEDAYQKYMQYAQMPFDNLNDAQKEEFFELWKQFKGAEK